MLQIGCNLNVFVLKSAEESGIMFGRVEKYAAQKINRKG